MKNCDKTVLWGVKSHSDTECKWPCASTAREAIRIINTINSLFVASFDNLIERLQHFSSNINVLTIRKTLLTKYPLF